MMKIFAILFRWPLAYVKFAGGEYVIRKIYKTPFDEFIVYGITKGTSGILLKNGKISEGRYILQWKPANAKAEQIAMLLKLEN